MREAYDMIKVQLVTNALLATLIIPIMNEITKMVTKCFMIKL